MEIALAESAYADLADIQAHYNYEGVPEVGKRLLSEILGHVQALAAHPSIGRIVPEFGEERIRELIRPPFRIVYLHEDNTIRIVRVWRSERLLRLPDSGSST